VRRRVSCPLLSIGPRHGDRPEGQVGCAATETHKSIAGQLRKILIPELASERDGGGVASVAVGL